jgi:CheY-like chemotaxis protein
MQLTYRRNARVLIVDDDPDDRNLIFDSFKEKFCDSDLFALNDGQELLEYLGRRGRYKNAEHPLPELILLDLNLPVKDGREALAEIKTDQQLRHIPVVIFTTSDAQKDVLQMYELGANSYVTKPVAFTRFVEVIHSIGSYWLSTVQLAKKN